ncbi:MAG TPA: S9 family peptidase [Longimicrobiales bacterium]|nr:S9 family peptidase [Longimicrobiales bacterium]
MRPTAAPAVLAVLLMAPALHAQQGPSDRLTLADYLEFESVGSPELSPDGDEILFSRRWVDKVNDRSRTSLWIMNADGSRPRVLLDGSSPQWSPDGSRIAYTTDGEPRGDQIFVKWMDEEGPGTQITRLEYSPSDVTWMPDGKSILFRMSIPKESDGWKVESQLSEYRPRGATWTEAPRVVEDLAYRRDRQGFTEDDVSQLFIVPAEGGTARQVTFDEYGVGSIELTPDGRTVLFSSRPRIEDADYEWRQSDIYAADLATGQIRQITNRSGTESNPTVSPDGRMVAYTGYEFNTDTYRDTRLHVMNIDGSNQRVLTEELDRSPGNLIWADDGSGIYFSTGDRGTENLYFVDLDGEIRQVTEGNHLLEVEEITNGVAIGTLEAPHKPGDLIMFDVRRPSDITQLTDVNADVLAGKTLGEHEEIWFKGADGWDIQGWIIKPPDFDPSRKYPMILSIHGGPHSMYDVGFNFGWQEHAANGYVVLYTNPRGSTGYGSAFGNAIKNAYPGKDYDDLMAGVDAVIANGYIDTNNLFVYGCSGGGVLTSWIVGHTDRFAAASANCPVTNWLSFVGTTDGPNWYRNFANYPWEDPSEHLRRSPLMYVGNVTTPTMLMTGVNDLRTPIAQTEEYYEALKVLKVPTAMIRFNDEWHGTSSNPSNFIRTQLYLREWFEMHSRPSPTVTTDSDR